MAASAQQVAPVLSLRDRRRIRTKRQVQAEALRLFQEKGFRGTTVDDIAHAAAMSPRTFFRYFPTKEDVLFWDEYDEPAFATPVWEQPVRGDPVAHSVAVVRTILCDVYQADPERLLARIKISFSHPEVWATYLSRQLASTLRYFPHLAKSWGGSPDELRMRVLAAALYSAVTVAVERWAHNDGREPLGQLFDEAIAALAEGAGHLVGVGSDVEVSRTARVSPAAGSTS